MAVVMTNGASKALAQHKGQRTLRGTEHVGVRPNEENVTYHPGSFLIFRGFRIFPGISKKPRSCTPFKLIAWKGHPRLSHAEESPPVQPRQRVLPVSRWGKVTPPSPHSPLL